MPPAFSVIVPTFNRARMLRTALSTVRAQTFADWECLVVDDGSTDDTPSVLADFASDPRFRSARLDKNRGMNAARNAALERASGRWATFLDSDDLWLPGRLEAFAARASAAPAAGFLFSNAYLWRFDRVVGTLFDPGRAIPEGKVPGYYALGERHLPYVTTNVCVLREAFSRFGGFDVSLTTDTDVWARLIAGGLEVAALRRPLSVRRVHGGQLSSKYVSNYDELLKAVEQCGADDERRARLREEMCLEVASYLIKSAKPREARAFMLDKLGGRARRSPLYRATFAPAWALNAARLGRELYVRARYSRALAPVEYRRVAAWIEPLLDAEA